MSSSATDGLATGLGWTNSTRGHQVHGKPPLELCTCQEKNWELLAQNEAVGLTERSSEGDQ